MDSRPSKEREKDGLKTRTEVLGSAWVEKSQANVDDFNREFNEYLHSHCWNDIWNRPGLPRKTRSLLNLAMLTALGKEHELKLHIRGALNNGVTKDEIQAILHQIAVYAGVPLGVECFRAARKVFAEVEKGK
jgi:4-carboxymuconolactone decarboxylase